ncbi:MAG TPA: PQQ-binding-like beta-propeller repeat protein, partial [Phototrophicaceae bacterium]|nr:PQQ-binding-like beta-propeller repeat protein [Phototrophicaceae bacterium]
MNIVKFLSRHRLLGAALLLIPLLAACGPAPLGTSWAGLRTVGPEQNILVAFNDRLVMVSPTDGKAVPLRNEDGEIRMDDQGNPRLWEIRQSANSFFSSPLVINDEKLLAAGYNQMLYSIDLKTARIENGTGTPIPANTGNLVADLVGDNERVYAGLSSKNLVAINLEDYSVEWTAATKHGVWSSPLLVEDVLYFASLDHFIYAVDAQSGDQLWSLDVGGAVASAPAYANGKLYVGSFARKLYEISTSGEILNTYDTVDWIWGTPAVVDGILYAADLVGNVYALDTTENLQEIWQVKTASQTIRPTPLVTDQYVLVASRDQKLYWLNREDGSPVMDNEGRALMREMQGAIFSDILLIQPNEQTDIPEPMVVVSTLTPGQMLVAYSLA